MLSQKGVLVETEHFTNRGGWVADQQFEEQMGSSYLMAHGMGTPVNDAFTNVQFKKTGNYHVWVRTKNWAPGNWEAPGRFKVEVNGKILPVEFGTEKGWKWQYGGKVKINKKKTLLKLKDLTGFNGRCDAIYFSSKKVSPPNDLKKLKSWREKYAARINRNIPKRKFDVVVIGGGLAGCGAAIAAAEQGMKVALVNDRPVLGGNASEEIRVHTLGIYGKSKRILTKIDTKHWPNGSAEAIPDSKKRQKNMDEYKNITQLLFNRAFAVKMKNNKIKSVDIKHIPTGKKQRLVSDIFIDCTGDGWIGFWAGAEFKYGREASSEYNEGWDKYDELWSPDEADNRVMGTSLLWNSEKTDSKVSFPEVPWALPVAKKHAAINGEWYWEYSDNNLNQITDAEQIRDHMFRAIYGSFYNAKQNLKNANVKLKFVGYVSGKRESRRLMGDYIFTYNDAVEGRRHNDDVVEETREVDGHYQRILKNPDSPDFLSRAMFSHTPRYYIPFRSLYSKNISNLMMAGRCFSCSHVGLHGPRVMLTTGQMGIATGYAAFLCKKYKTNPRGIYKNHIKELRGLIGYK